MSNAFKCNKCGETFEGEPAQTLEIDTEIFIYGFPIMSAVKNLDLCEDCFCDLLEWLGQDEFNIEED